jgi:enoyl-CoA hydratase
MMATMQAVEQKQLINYTVDAGVGTIEMSDPPANTYTYEMMQQLDAAILQARMDDNVHVILLRGAGEKFFSAGASIPMLAKVDPQFKYYFCLHANETLCRLEQTPKLVIAALNGHTVGGGLEIAMACDIRIAKKEGGKIGLPEVNLGVLPGTGGTQRLSRVVGRARAIELMATGRTFSFEEALEMGLIHYIYERESFQARGGDGFRGWVRRGTGPRTRIAANAFYQRGRKGRIEGVRREAAAGIQGEVAVLMRQLES